MQVQNDRHMLLLMMVDPKGAQEERGLVADSGQLGILSRFSDVGFAEANTV